MVETYASKDALRIAAFQEAAAFCLPEGWQEGREIVTDIAIDNPTTADRDDALSLKSLLDESMQAEVAITDISSFRHLLPAVMTHAQVCGETRYLRTSNIPMIPPVISEGHLSLNAGSLKPAFLVRTRIDPQGNVGQAEFSFAALNAINTTYDRVNKLIAGRGQPHNVNLMRRYAKFAKGLLEARRNNGALAFYLPEIGIMSGIDGDLIEFTPGTSQAAQLIVQEFMILTNIAVAEYAAHHNIPVPFRNHSIRTDAPAELVERLLAQEDLNGHVLGRVYERARYGATLSGHAALGVEAYLHATAPLRRFVDCMAQANIRAFILGEPYPFSREETTLISAHINDIQDEIKDAQARNFRTRKLAATLGKVGQPITPIDPHAAVDLGPHLLRVKSEGVFSEAAVRQLGERMLKKVVDVNDIDNIIDALNTARLEDETATQLSQYLQTFPHLAFSALHQAAAKGRLTNLSATAAVFDKGYRAHLSATFPNGMTYETYADAPGKKSALQHGAARLIAGILGVELDASTAQNEAGHTPETSANALDPKNLLQNYAQQRGLKLPDYTTTHTSGTTTNPTFTSVVSLKINDETLVATATGKTKKQAEASVAEEMFKQLPSADATIENPQQSKPTLENFPTAEAQENPIGDLQTLCARSKYGQPVFTIHDLKGRKFSCTVRIRVPGKETLEFVFEGSSKKAARAGAALLALNSDHFNSDN